MVELTAVTLAAALAGFVDAIVGGGGLVLVPALFSAYPSAAPATLFGTNKTAAVWGTAWATGQYARRVRMNWGTLAPAAAAALAGSLAGTGLALRHGTRFVRFVFIVVVGALILRTGYDAFLR